MLKCVEHGEMNSRLAVRKVCGAEKYKACEDNAHLNIVESVMRL